MLFDFILDYHQPTFNLRNLLPQSRSDDSYFVFRSIAMTDLTFFILYFLIIYLSFIYLIIIVIITIIIIIIIIFICFFFW